MTTQTPLSAQTTHCCGMVAGDPLTSGVMQLATFPRLLLMRATGAGGRFPRDVHYAAVLQGAAKSRLQLLTVLQGATS